MELNKELFDLSVVSEGNTARLAKLMERAANGEKLTVATIGGSITAGSSSSVQDNCYASLTAKWWRDNFPNAQFDFYNMGIGATTSVLGVHRLQRDIITKKPDFLVVEFAVNDNEYMYPYYENIIRRVMLEDQDMAVIMLFMTTEAGWNRQEQQIPIGEAYGVPMISYHNVIHKLIADGKIEWKDISPDDIHPNDRGHAICASLIASYLDNVKERYVSLSKEIQAVPEALYGERYMEAEFYTAASIEADELGDWQIDPSLNYYHLNTAWVTKAAGAPLSFKKSFKEVNIMFRKMVSNPNIGKAKILVDGQQVELLDGSFPGGWGDYYDVATVYKTDDVKEHTLSVECTEGEFCVFGLLFA